MTKKLLILLTIIVLISCNTTNDSNKHSVYFGGEIKNPTAGFICLKKDSELIDTLFLSAQNKFSKHFTQLRKGLYTFHHGNELQYIFLDAQDSISIHLNTKDFDESLTFSGKGAEKNEYLLNLFLENEKEDKLFHQYFRLSPQEFKDKVDLLQELKYVDLEEFEISQNNRCKAFSKIAKATIDYSLYKKMEYYPWAHKNITTAKHFEEIDDSFYAYRKNIDLNDEDMIGYYVYTNYLINYLYNQAFQNLKNKEFSKNEIRIEFFKAVEKNITLESFKNKLLMDNILHNILKNPNTNDLDVLHLFLNISTNLSDKEKIARLIENKISLQNNQSIPNFTLTNTKNIDVPLNRVIRNKKAVVYFWSKKYMSPKYLSSRITYLRKKHPNYTFIGINIDQNPYPATTEASFPFEKHQFKLPKTSIAQKFCSSGYPRTLIISNKGQILNSYTNISTKDFSTSLASF